MQCPLNWNECFIIIVVVYFSREIGLFFLLNFRWDHTTNREEDHNRRRQKTRVKKNANRPIGNTSKETSSTSDDSLNTIEICFHLERRHPTRNRIENRHVMQNPHLTYVRWLYTVQGDPKKVVHGYRGWFLQNY